MKIALINEWSQSAKNPIIFNELSRVAEKQNHTIYNVGMTSEQDHHLTYIHLGIMASLLLNSKAVDFVITGCGTGQGALISLNAYPGVVCGYCIEPTDAFLFSQINNGNALSIPFAKGFGWGAELNLSYIFEKAFSGTRGEGYPQDKKEIQNRNALLLDEVKQAVSRPYLDALKQLDPVLVKQAVTSQQFKACFIENSQDPEIKQFVTNFYL